MNSQKVTLGDAPLNCEDARKAHDHLLSIASVTVRLSEIHRAPRYPNGSRETDVEHSFHLALSAGELAALYFPGLDVGLVTQFSLIHDLPEIYAGDVWTFNISEENLIKKAQIERNAAERLLKELPPHMARLLLRYEKQEEPEARFVRFIDKLLPYVVHIMSGDANTFREDFNVDSIKDLTKKAKDDATRIQAMFPEFPFIHLVQELILDTSHASIFKSNQ